MRAGEPREALRGTGGRPLTRAPSPRNRTDAHAPVFTEPDRTGADSTLRPRTGYGGERLRLRSVLLFD
ncbi:hypothetical protein ACE1SV_05870 [Streptomyces sp. E-15]